MAVRRSYTRTEQIHSPLSFCVGIPAAPLRQRCARTHAKEHARTFVRSQTGWEADMDMPAWLNTLAWPPLLWWEGALLSLMSRMAHTHTKERVSEVEDGVRKA